LLDGVDALFVKPVGDLPGAIRRFAQVSKLLPKLAKKDGLDVAKVAAATSLGCLPGAMRIDFSSVPHTKNLWTPRLPSNRFGARFVAVRECFALGAVLFWRIADQMAAQRRLDRRRDDLCADGLRKRGSLIASALATQSLCHCRLERKRVRNPPL
jgi:hypothetical protein